MRLDGQAEARSFEESFDYVIVGSGAGGAAAARVLADTGASLAIVEEGPALDTKEFGDKLFPALRHMFRDMGGGMARGKAFIPILQGRCLGGSTVINSAIIWRLPEDVWLPWRDEFGLGEAFSMPELHENWDLLEKELGVAVSPPEVWGENNRLMDVAKTRLGIRAAPIRRLTPGCRGSARCLTGCPHGAKQSMLVSYLPYAESKGAALITSARVDRVLMNGDRASGVAGYFHHPAYKRDIAPFKIHARKAVIVAASAIQTPGLLARSGVRSAHLGRHFQAHPGAALMGLFDRKVDMWFGATQGYDADERRVDGRYKIETIGLPPEIAFTRMPGVGRKWLSTMAEASRAAVWAVQLRAYAQGRVRDRFFGIDVEYDLEPRDVESLRRGVRLTAEMLFAAGAREVLTGIHGLPERLKSADELKVLDDARLDASNFSMILSHLFGTARMSPAASGGVVGTDFSVHGTKNFYVVDSSIFPTNIGVNPQHTIMAIAMHAAKKIAEGGGK